jgi:hypothetical protein
MNIILSVTTVTVSTDISIQFCAGHGFQPVRLSAVAPWLSFVVMWTNVYIGCLCYHIACLVPTSGYWRARHLKRMYVGVKWMGNYAREENQKDEKKLSILDLGH